MGENLVLAGQRSGGDLRHHEAGVESRASSQKGRQSLIERGIYQAFDTPFRDSGQRSQCDRKIVECKGDGLTMKVSAGEYIALADLIFPRSREDEWIIHRGVHLDLKCPPTEADRVANCTMNLRNAAQGVRVLEAPTIFVRGANLASFKHASKVSRCFQLTGMWARFMDAFVKRGIGAAQAIKR